VTLQTEPWYERTLAGLKRSPLIFNEISVRINRFLGVVYVLAVIALIIEHGFYLDSAMQELASASTYCLLAVFLLQQLIKLLLAPHRRDYYIERRSEFILSAILLVQVLSYPLLQPWYAWFSRVFHIGSVDQIFYMIAQTFIFLNIAFSLARFSRKLSLSRIQPARVFIGSFALVILTGAMFLMFPRSSHGGISFVDALFTSTSCVCVTGLTVLDPGTTFTYQGLTIMMILIQIGGLGLMTVTTFFALFHGRLGVRERVMVQEFTNTETLGEVKHMLRSIILFTLTFECAGLLVLYLSWDPSVYPFVPQKLFHSAYHSVSAFCNAGFSTLSSNLADRRVVMNLPINLTVCTLIIFGGLGFAVMANAAGVLGSRFHGDVVKKKLNVHSRIVIITTAALLIAGTVWIYVFERSTVLAEFGEGGKWLASFFQSVTTRTAGFNTVNIGALSVPSVFMMIMLMFIGASPGSTGGGIKTTTFAIIMMSAVNVVRGKSGIDLFRRRITTGTVNRAFSIFTLSMVLVIVSTMVMSIVEQAAFLDILFEVVSAFGTVGLSRGITPQLSDISKYTLVITMYIGRVGVMMLIMALSLKPLDADFQYPGEDVPVG
jgi:potassium uptake TrkH family protein